MTQGGDRWYSVRRATSGWIAGTTWTAEAPVPTTATRLPARLSPGGHRDVWNRGPANVASPGTSGALGSASTPGAATTTSAVQSPREVATRQTAAPSSQASRRTSWPSRRWGRTPNPSTTRSM